MKIMDMATSIGAQVTEADLDRDFNALQNLFHERHVLAIRGNEITPNQQLEFASRLGEVWHHPYVPSIDGYPGIMEIGQVTKITETWHSDSTHDPTPPAISMLVARRIPPVGGDTMFANQHAAYESLSAGLKEMLNGQKAVHYNTDLADNPASTAHPVVRTHPVTGRRALFVNGNYTRHFEHMTEAESRPLLEYLYEVGSRPEFTCRHRWALGDLLMWDNAAVQHRVVPDFAFDPETRPRVLHRITVIGEPPR